MKISRFLATALLAILLNSGAHAATVSLNLGNVNSSTVTGTTTTSPSDSLSYSATGTLAADTKITFTYSAPAVPSGSLTSSGSLGSAGSLGTASVTTVNKGSAQTSGTLPVIVMSNLFGGSGTVTIENLTSAAQSFAAYFTALVKTGNRPFTVSYAVVSSVPLPASAVLFATALVAMAGFAARKKHI